MRQRMRTTLPWAMIRLQSCSWLAGLQSRQHLRAWLWNEVAWVEPLLRTMLAQMCFQNLWLALTKTIPQTCRSKALLMDTIL